MAMKDPQKKSKTTPSPNVVRRRPRTRSQSEDVDGNGTTDNVKKINGNEDKNEQEMKGDFDNFEICKKTKKKLKENGIKYLFPVQSQTFDAVYIGSDVVVQARTGTGKTLAFGLPVLEKLGSSETERKRGRKPQFLTLAPTRELAIQIQKEFNKFQSSDLNVACFYGGTPYGPQKHEIYAGLDVLVGTPGRILDLIQKNGLDLSQLKYVAIDEADRMMDFGFMEALDEILSYAYNDGNKPQTLLFSATVPTWLRKTANKYMDKNVQSFDLIGNSVNKSSMTVEHKAIKCSYHQRAQTIKDVVQVYSGKYGKSIVFTSTKAEANEMSTSNILNMSSQVLHGDIPQKRRETTLQDFRDGKFNCLVATDVAARGIDIPEIDLVIQTEPPNDVDSYIHRSGRTGRAGRVGICIVFYKPGQEGPLTKVERVAGINFKRIGPPQREDIIKSNVDDTVRDLEQVTDNALESFIPAARELIEKRGAEQALASALAFLSGAKDGVVQRSLLCAAPDYTTFIMKLSWEMRSNGLVFSVLRKYFDEEVINRIRGMRMLKDKMGSVFDVPTADMETFKNNWQDDGKITLEVATELPELLEGLSSSSFGGNSRGGGGRGFGGNRGGRGGFGRSGGGGGYGRGGGGGNRNGGFKRSFNGDGNGYNKKARFN